MKINLRNIGYWHNEYVFLKEVNTLIIHKFIMIVSMYCADNHATASDTIIPGWFIAGLHFGGPKAQVINDSLGAVSRFKLYEARTTVSSQITSGQPRVAKADYLQKSQQQKVDKNKAWLALEQSKFNVFLVFMALMMGIFYLLKWHQGYCKKKKLVQNIDQQTVQLTSLLTKNKAPALEAGSHIKEVYLCEKVSSQASQHMNRTYFRTSNLFRSAKQRIFKQAHLRQQSSELQPYSSQVSQWQSVNKKRKHSVLIVANLIKDSEWLTMALREHFYLFKVANEQDGLTLAKTEIPDLILLALDLPESKGFSFVSQLSAEIVTSHIPIIFLLATSNKKEEHRALQLGCIDCITQPFDESELKYKIRNAVDKQTAALKHYLQAGKMVLPVHEKAEDKGVVFLKRLEGYLQSRYQDKDLTIEELAKNMFMCERQLQRKLKELIKCTPREYLRIYRLEKSCEYMQEGYSGLVLSDMVGFSSYSYFSRTFKKVYKVNPSSYVEELDLKQKKTVDDI